MDKRTLKNEEYLDIRSNNVVSPMFLKDNHIRFLKNSNLYFLNLCLSRSKKNLPLVAAAAIPPRAAPPATAAAKPPPAAIEACKNDKPPIY